MNTFPFTVDWVIPAWLPRIVFWAPVVIPSPARYPYNVLSAPFVRACPALFPMAVVSVLVKVVFPALPPAIKFVLDRSESMRPKVSTLNCFVLVCPYALIGNALIQIYRVQIL